MISSAFAAEHAAEHGHQAVAFYQDPHLWVYAAFFLVVGFAWKPVGRAIAAGLDARAAKIRARLEEAEKLRDDANEMLATYQRKQRDAMKEAEEIIAHAKAEAARLAEQASKDLAETLKRREQQAMDRIAQAEARAVKDVQDLAVDVAVAAARQVLAQTISADQAARLIDGAITDLPQKLH